MPPENPRFDSPATPSCTIVGGGAAGFMAAITLAEAQPGWQVTILEKGREVLQKVKVSGGGRCNVTHDAPDPAWLVQNYPRGSRELLGPFTRFGQKETVRWFADRGVKLKIESDGRMFPVTDQSETIVNCLKNAARQAGVDIRTGYRINGLEPLEGGRWKLLSTHEKPLVCHKVMLATGSNPACWEWLQKLGHSIVEPVPSLFTFPVPHKGLFELQGLSLPNVGLWVSSEGIREKNQLRIIQKLRVSGSLLITHWGLSGFGVLKLSAWGARLFHDLGYQFNVVINWLEPMSIPEISAALSARKSEWSKKQVLSQSPFPQLPIRLWKFLAGMVIQDSEITWAHLKKDAQNELAIRLGGCEFPVRGKSTFKEEFVTAGGVSLKELDFKTFQSKLRPNLFLAGEILDIDAVTGGFNFQAAWTGGWLAGKGMANSVFQ